MIGNGVVLDPHALIAEIDKLQAQGVAVTPENLRVADNAPLILSLHRELDVLREEAAAPGAKIGTTGRGIGPAYEDKVGRRAIRLVDLADPDTLAAEDRPAARPPQRAAARPRTSRRSMRRRSSRSSPPSPIACSRSWIRSGRCSTQRRRAGARILFEGAQGALLDIDHGTYPFVTSSNTVAGQAAAGSGLGPGAIGYVLGITKAYTTRVGEGPFPTEQDNEVGQFLGERGREFGTVTGRKRRCGWFDAVLVRQTAKVSGIQGHCADQARRPRRAWGAQGLHRLRARRRAAGPAAGGPGGAGGGGSGLRNAGRVAGIDRRRAILGGSAGAGGEICPLYRGVDRGAGRLTFDQSGARRYNPCPRSVSGLTLFRGLLG